MGLRRNAFIAALAATAVVAWAPSPAGAHDVGLTLSAREHTKEDTVTISAKRERQYSRHTIRASRPDARAAATALAADDPGQVGQWGPLANWPVVAIHSALLPNGKVLAYDSVGDQAAESYQVHDHTRATVWDPQTGSQTPVDVNTGYNIFCSGLAHLVNGAVFVAGGNKNAQLDGIVQTHVFDPATNSWTLGPNMSAGRWYPSVTPLANGEMLITEGGPDIPEVRKTDGTLRSLASAPMNLPLYPWMDVAPNGRTFYSGPSNALKGLDTTGGGSWQNLGQRDGANRSYGSHVLYDIGKILVSGGAASKKDARVIDLNGATPKVTTTGSMAYGRRQHNLTVLADGTVLATGGNSSGASLVDMNAGVYPAELWSSSTGQWRTLSSMQVTRQYHSTALLLPDGRVLSAGGGVCGACDQVGYLAKNAEVFSPPYLFKQDGSGDVATRPQVNTAPDSVAYGASFSISSPDAAAVSKVALVRLGAVTHSVNMEQRYVPLNFSKGSGTLTATTPANANIAPPGIYMLFVIDSSGVPSVAKMVSVGSGAPPANQPPTTQLTSPANNSSFLLGTAIPMAASASDSDGTVQRVEFWRAGRTTKLSQDTTAPYTSSWTPGGGGTYVLTAVAYDNSGNSTTSAPVTVTVHR